MILRFPLLCVLVQLVSGTSLDAKKRYPSLLEEEVDFAGSFHQPSRHESGFRAIHARFPARTGDTVSDADHEGTHSDEDEYADAGHRLEDDRQEGSSSENEEHSSRRFVQETAEDLTELRRHIDSAEKGKVPPSRHGLAPYREVREEDGGYDELASSQNTRRSVGSRNSRDASGTMFIDTKTGSDRRISSGLMDGESRHSNGEITAAQAKEAMEAASLVSAFGKSGGMGSGDGKPEYSRTRIDRCMVGVNDMFVTFQTVLGDYFTTHAATEIITNEYPDKVVKLPKGIAHFQEEFFIFVPIRWLSFQFQSLSSIP